MDKIHVYNVDTLAAKAGISRRTVHYYLQRGLLMQPQGEGRGCFYTEEHLNRLKELQQLSSQGVPLAKIKEYFEHKGGFPVEEKIIIQPEESSMPEVETWERHTITDEIELHIKVGSIPMEVKRELLEEIAAQIKKRLSPVPSRE